MQHASTNLVASVVVCVYTEERWPQIERALSSIVGQTVRPGQVVVVVDHNPALCQRLAAQYPDIEVIASKFERGLSAHAIPGSTRLRVTWFVFLDDDAYGDPCWLQSLLACYDDESVLGAGGLVLPDWSPAGPPGWLPEEFLWVVGCSYPVCQRPKLRYVTQSAPTWIPADGIRNGGIFRFLRGTQREGLPPHGLRGDRIQHPTAPDAPGWANNI